MIFSNLAGTTSKQFNIGGDSSGQLISNNAWDIYWKAANPSTGAVNPNVKSLPESADLNDYHTVAHYGQYYAEYDKGSTIINIPDDVNEEFSLVVSPMTGGWDGFVVQELLHKSGRRYERHYIFNATPNWSEWKKVAFVQEVGSFTLEPTLRGTTGMDYGYTLTSQFNNYVFFSNLLILKLHFTINMVNNQLTYGELLFKGLPFASHGVYGNNITGSLYVDGIVDSGGIPVSFYPAPPESAQADDVFGIKFIKNSTVDNKLLTATSLSAYHLTNDTMTKFRGFAMVFVS